MKKTFTIIFAVFSAIILCGYVVSIASIKEDIHYKVKDINGDRKVLENNIVKTNIATKLLDTYEFIISKDKEELKKRNPDAFYINVSDEQFKDKELFRGIKYLELPPYEDDQYKAVVYTSSEYKNDAFFKTINVSCKNKKTDKLKKFKSVSPITYNCINSISIFNENGIIKFVFIGENSTNSGTNSYLELYSIDIEKETIKSEKKIDLNKIINKEKEFMDFSNQMYNDGKIFFSVNSAMPDEKSEFKIICVNLKDSSIKEYNYSEDILKENKAEDDKSKNKNDQKSIEGQINNVRSNLYTNKNKFIKSFMCDETMEVIEFDTKTLDFKKYNTLNLSEQIYKKEKIKKLDSNSNYYLNYRILKVNNNKIYLQLDEYENYNEDSNTYINVLDLKENKSLYLGKVETLSKYSVFLNME